MASVKRRPGTDKKGHPYGWEVRYVDPTTGKRPSRNFPLKKDADAFKRQVEREIEAGEHVARSSSVTVADAEREYVLALDRRQREGTYRNASYRKETSHLRVHVVPWFGRRKMVDITEEDADGFFSALRDKRYSPETVGAIFATLGRLLDYGIRRKWVKRNVARIVRTWPENRLGAPETIRRFDTDQAMALYRYFLDPQSHNPKWTARYAAMGRCMVFLGMFGGLRSGEVRGLTWHAVDFEGGTLTIDQQVDEDRQIAPTKNRQSTRTIPVADVVLEQLDAWRVHARENEHGLLFTTRYGNPISPQDLHSHIWKRALVDLGYAATDPGGWPHFHALRHFATSVMQQHMVPARQHRARRRVSLAYRWTGRGDVLSRVRNACRGPLLAEGGHPATCREPVREPGKHSDWRECQRHRRRRDPLSSVPAAGDWLMRAGKRDRTVRVEAYVEADDGYNTTQTWTTLADVPCQYIPSAGREAREALGQEATLPATFNIPWANHLAVIDPAYRLRFPASDDGRVFDIKSVVEIARLNRARAAMIAADAERALAQIAEKKVNQAVTGQGWWGVLNQLPGGNLLRLGEAAVADRRSARSTQAQTNYDASLKTMAGIRAEIDGFDARIRGASAGPSKLAAALDGAGKTGHAGLKKISAGAGDAKAKLDEAAHAAQALMDRLFPDQARDAEYRKDIADLTKLYKDGKVSVDQFLEARARINRDYDKDRVKDDPYLITEPTVDTSVVDNTGKMISDTWGKIRAENDNLGESFAQTTRNVTSSLQGLMNSIKSGDWLSSLSGLVDVFTQLAGSGVFGKGIAARVSSFRSYGGGKAIGGPVLPGTDYLVGERGPEILRMGGAGGSIVPNHMIGGPAVVEVHVAANDYFDARVGRVSGGVTATALNGAQRQAATRGRQSLD